MQDDGSYVVRSVATPTSFKVRGAAYVGSKKVIPVIFIPGTMGSNLKVRRDIKLPSDYPVPTGGAAWRPPNGTSTSWVYAKTWEHRSPATRQLILHPNFTEVDDHGPLGTGISNLEPSVMTERGWGEVYSDSYGMLLIDLQNQLDMTFQLDPSRKREVRGPWKEVMHAMKDDPIKRWGVRSVDPLTETDLENYAQYQYPVYAFGYNWLQSCGVAAQGLEKRIDEIIAWWSKRKHECKKVILLTHSMGGLVARACAKRIPDKIGGVIHGVMPALGAPLAYRRLACGTEIDNPKNGKVDNYIAGKFADIGGRTTEDTTPVFAVSPGALELLPNQLYPRPWLHARVIRSSGPTGRQATAFDYLHLPNDENPNPYELYRDMRSWYRLINPALADPAKLYKGEVENVIRGALKKAEEFHYSLGDYYHPTTFAYYGNDSTHTAYGQIRWVAREQAGIAQLALTARNIREARYLQHANTGARTVEVEGKGILDFEVEPQESRGDDTVPYQSGSGPGTKIKKLFATHGYRHQESYNDRSTVLLTRYCIVKIVQELHKNAQPNQ